MFVVPVPYCIVLFGTEGFPRIPYWPVPAKCTGHWDRYSTVYIDEVAVCRMIYTGQPRSDNGRTIGGKRAYHVGTEIYPMPRVRTHAQMHPPVQIDTYHIRWGYIQPDTTTSTEVVVA